MGVVAASLGERHRPEVELDRASEPRTGPVVDQDLQEAPGGAGLRGLQVKEGHPVDQLCLQTTIPGHNPPPPAGIREQLRLLDRRELDFNPSPQRFGEVRKKLLEHIPSLFIHLTPRRPMPPQEVNNDLRYCSRRRKRIFSGRDRPLPTMMMIQSSEP